MHIFTQKQIFNLKKQLKKSVTLYAQESDYPPSITTFIDAALAKTDIAYLSMIQILQGVKHDLTSMQLWDLFWCYALQKCNLLHQNYSLTTPEHVQNARKTKNKLKKILPPERLSQLVTLLSALGFR